MSKLYYGLPTKSNSDQERDDFPEEKGPDSRQKAVPASKTALPFDPALGSIFVRRCSVFYIVALLGFWAIAITAKYATSHWMGQPFSLRSLFFADCASLWSDFLDFDPRTERFMPKTGLPGVVYPAPMTVAYIALTRWFPFPLGAFVQITLLAWLLAGALIAAALGRSKADTNILKGAALISTALAYPLMFVIERGNVETFVWIVEALSITAFVFRRYLSAGLLIALAASMKLFPGILFALLLSRRRYRELAISVTAIIPITLFGLWCVGPSISQANSDVISSLVWREQAYIVTYRAQDNPYDHSLFAFIKQFLHYFYADPATLNSKILHLSMPYMLFVALGFVVLYLVRIRKLPILNQVIVLIILSVTLPSFSGEYTLLHMYAAWALFFGFLAFDVTEGRESIPFAAAVGILASFAFLFSPSNYISVSFVGRGAQFKTLTLVILGSIFLMIPMRSFLFQEPGDQGRASDRRRKPTTFGRSP